MLIRTVPLTLLFENQGEFAYRVPLVKLQNMSVEELNDKKLIALLPFQLLKLRKKIENLRTEENLEELQNFVVDDIIDSIYKNEAVGNISYSDALDLIELTTKLYMKIYSKYKELEDLTMRMCDQSLELISDKYEKTVEELEEENTELKNEVAGMKGAMNNMESAINELRATISRLEKQLQVQQEK